MARDKSVMIISSLILLLAIALGFLIFLDGGFGATANAVSGEGCDFSEKEYIVSGDSMFPVLRDGDNATSLIGYYDCNAVQRSDVVLVNFSWRERQLIKFVRGVPGDSLELEQADGRFNILVNGEVLKNSIGEKYTIEESSAELISVYIEDYNGIIPRDTYLLLGNNPLGTYDSTRFGLIDKSNIVGKIRVGKA